MVNLPNLNIHDMPEGVVQPDAYCIQWLQDILDFWYHMVPFSSTVTSADLTCLANTGTIQLPDDFILDVRNGYLVPIIPGDSLSLRRRVRVSFQKFLNRYIYYQKQNSALYPIFYTILGGIIDQTGISTKQTIQVTPKPIVDVPGKLWYYKLPAKLKDNTRPDFPNDYVCTEYLRIRALEWARIYDPGTAQKFCDKIVAGMKAAGLMNEPEDDEIPFDDVTFRNKSNMGIYSTSYAWMGMV